MADLYLDVETDRGRLTVLGLLVGESIHQWAGRRITGAALERALPAEGRLITYNGDGFDIPWVRRSTGVDLGARFESVDLLPICRSLGWRGGQKVSERRAGFVRYPDVAGLHGRHAVQLWRRYERGDRGALRLLLRYNRVDLYGLRAIHMHLARAGRV